MPEQSPAATSSGAGGEPGRDVSAGPGHTEGLAASAHRYDTPAPDSPAAEATRVRSLYDFFDDRRARGEAFDEGDEQNVHAWMRSVTEWIEAQEADRG